MCGTVTIALFIAVWYPCACIKALVLLVWNFQWEGRSELSLEMMSARCKYRCICSRWIFVQGVYLVRCFLWRSKSPVFLGYDMFESAFKCWFRCRRLSVGFQRCYTNGKEAYTVRIQLAACTDRVVIWDNWIWWSLLWFCVGVHILRGVSMLRLKTYSRLSSSSYSQLNAKIY
jgi:hypothetical protein